jgi:hypothetical protein
VQTREAVDTVGVLPPAADRFDVILEQPGTFPELAVRLLHVTVPDGAAVPFEPVTVKVHVTVDLFTFPMTLAVVDITEWSEAVADAEPPL